MILGFIVLTKFLVIDYSCHSESLEYMRSPISKKAARNNAPGGLIANSDNDHALGPPANTCLTWRFLESLGLIGCLHIVGAGGTPNVDDNGMQRPHKDAFLVGQVITLITLSRLSTLNVNRHRSNSSRRQS